MFEIKGTVTTAVCYAKVVEEEAIEQIRRMCSYALTENSRVRIMPDVHAGKGCTIGTTMTVEGRACPNVVGVDIGCGMYTVKLAEREIDFARVDEACHYIPSGMNVWEGRIERFDLTGLRCYRSLRDSRRLERSLGTLGGGSFVGFIALILIFIVGHTINFALSILSSFVHTARLQYIEFFNKFYVDGGRLFDPASVNTKYSEIIEEAQK